ncbi:NlpC/P60 family protein [Paraburkholderia sp. SEWSISQ10-3 4]|uniref:NlpC/P60 family protein n=1 Tax=Paraburkholderia TaxID=1822464 RepID=UPI00225ABA90|nr:MULTISPECIES: NlpC/P60 family protein [Paraburkholderia]MCX4139139.1 NlpC/P60 family protein [Paraburkholderia aspalathi]MDN7171828.1 NlpC/P60 family protein [Paraburkholderia sp. SEWSISQ10-3 4]MDQ6501467.1 NlpC/P60 family protein [Paraburkholderia aspalathi]
MRRLAFSLLTVLLLAACAGAPQKTSRGPGSSVVVTNGAYHAPPPGFPNFVDHSIGREEISIQAMSLVGIPYRWGGNTPDSGFDCSGLVRYVVSRAASVNLPRTTADMSGRGESVEPDEIAPGDLIFFNTTGRAHSHVGIYVGKLRFVNAPSTGGTVRLDYLTNPYWAKRFDGIRRVAAPAATPAPFDTPSYQAAAPQPERVAPVAQTQSAPAYAGVAVAAQASGYSANSAATRPSGYAGAPVAAEASSYTADPVAPQQTARVAATTRPPLTASGQPTVAAAAAPQADPFEPPPPGMSAAQMQARAAGAVPPGSVSAAQANTYDAAAGSANQQVAAAVRAEPPTITVRAPDPIDAAADAFEPPPPASVAVRQAQQARQADGNAGVQIMRASTASRGIPAPTQTTDDPIARFANGSY